MVDIQNIVQVKATIAASDSQFPVEFGKTLFVTADNSVLSETDLVHEYNNFAEVSAAFAEDTEPYKAALAYFSQDEFTLPPFIIAYRPIIAQYGRGAGNLATTIAGDAPFTGMLDTTSSDDNTLTVTIGTTPWVITLVGAAGSTLASVLEQLQDAFRAGGTVGTANANAPVGYDKITVSYNAGTSRVEIEWGFSEDSGDRATPLQLVVDESGLAGELGFNASSVGLGADGDATVPVGTIGNFFQSVESENGDWLFVTVDHRIVNGEAVNGQDYTGALLSITNWVKATKGKILLFDSHDRSLFSEIGPAAGVLINDLITAEPDSISPVYTPESEYQSISIAAMFSGTNLNRANSFRTAKFKRLPGMTPARLSNAEAAKLDERHINYYTTVGPYNILAQGTTLKPNVFIDMRHWLDWFTDRVRRDVFNLLVNAPVIPQTTRGLQQVRQVVQNACLIGVRNGGISQGRVSNTTRDDIRQVTGNQTFDGVLDTGFVVYVAPLSTMSDADFAARKIPPIHVWLRGSGAIHFVEISAVFD